MSIKTKRVIIVARKDGVACRAEFHAEGGCFAGDEKATEKLVKAGATFTVRVRGTNGENDPAGAENPVAKKILESWLDKDALESWFEQQARETKARETKAREKKARTQPLKTETS